MHQDGKTLIKILIVILVITAIGGYSLFQARNIIKGPRLAVISPQNGATVSNQTVEIKGTAENISYISLNDRQIYVDKNGTFDEELLLAPGYNIWTLQAKDKFGRTTSKNIQLVLIKNS